CGASGSQPPTKVQIPLCLSHHSKNPLTQEEVVARAATSRQHAAVAVVPPLPPIGTGPEAVLIP
ncbi:MAG: hypothetical protein ACC645_07145, partial [Pirellulales bacterium]